MRLCLIYQGASQCTYCLSASSEELEGQAAMLVMVVVDKRCLFLRFLRREKRATTASARNSFNCIWCPNNNLTTMKT